VATVGINIADVRAPAAEGTQGARWAGFDFTLRRSPAPDGNEKVRWNPWASTTVCTDEYFAYEPQIEPELVRGVIREQKERYRACYQNGLKRDPSLRGRVGLRLTIGPQGAVTDVKVVNNQVPDCEVVACLKTKFQTLTFPRAERESTIIYGLELLPN
jgi:hypothetical protein